MALNLNPEDYGIVGSLDKQGMEDRLDEIRKQIASFGPTPVASIQRSADPVYGAGVPAVEYVTKDRSEYAAKEQEVPQYLKDRWQKSQERTEAYLEKLAYVPEETPESTPKPGSKPKEEKERLRLPDLSETKKDEKIVAPERFLEGKTTKIKSDFEKKPSFDGRDFQNFLSLAKGTRQVSVTDKGMFDTDMPASPALNKLYNKLRDEGMSEDDMFKAAQYAGLTNVRTGKEGKSDFKQMVKAYKQGFTKGDKTKTEQVGKKTIYDWYVDQGGDKNKSMNKLLRQAGIGDYDSVSDARKYTEFLTDKLNRGRDINVGMDKAKKAFGNKFSLAEYDAALDYKGQDKKYIKNYLQDYLGRGGKVGQNVLDIFGL